MICVIHEGVSNGLQFVTYMQCMTWAFVLFGLGIALGLHWTGGDRR